MTTGREVARQMMGGGPEPQGSRRELVSNVGESMRGAPLLVEQARGILQSARMTPEGPSLTRGELQSVLWRLVDAAGLISLLVPDDSQGMPENPTGRGYFIGVGRGLPR